MAPNPPWHPLMDPGQVSGYYPQIFPGYPGAPEFDYYEAAPPGAALVGAGAGAGLAGAFAPAMAGTWQNLMPPRGLRPGGPISKLLEEIAQTVRSKPSTYEGTRAAEQKHGLEELGHGGAYKRVFRVPLQESSQPLAVAIQGKSPSTYQARDIMHPGHVRGVAPIWWYERGMPRKDVKVFAMPEIVAGKPVPPRSPSTGAPSWFAAPQALDLAEIVSKMARRGLRIGDLHSGNVLPEFSPQHDRFRPVVVDRGAMYPDVENRAYGTIHELLRGEAGFGYDQVNRQLINQFVQDPKFQSNWPALAEFIANNPAVASGSTGPQTLSAQLAAANRALGMGSGTIPRTPGGHTDIDAMFPPLPTPKTPSTWSPLNLGSPSPVPATPFSSGRSGEAVSDLLRGGVPSNLIRRSNQPDSVMERGADLHGRVVKRLRELAKENPEQALSVAEARKLLGSKTPSSALDDFNPMLAEETTGGGIRDRDLALEQLVKRQKIPWWVKQPSPFFKVTSSGPKTPWSRMLQYLDERDESSW